MLNHYIDIVPTLQEIYAAQAAHLPFRYGKVCAQRLSLRALFAHENFCRLLRLPAGRQGLQLASLTTYANPVT